MQIIHVSMTIFNLVGRDEFIMQIIHISIKILRHLFDHMAYEIVKAKLEIMLVTKRVTHEGR